MKKILILIALIAGWSFAAAKSEDGSRLWLRMEMANTTTNVTGVEGTAMTELHTYWQGGPVVQKRQKGLPRDGYTVKSQGDKIAITASNDACINCRAQAGSNVIQGK